MTKTIRAALALALATSVAAPALSGQEDIVVSPGHVGAAVSQELDRQIRAATWSNRTSHGDGYAILRFQRGEDGQPQNISFYRSSGVRSVDRVALNAVRRLGSRQALPDTGVADQPFQANIVLATSLPSYEKLAASLDRAERQRLASSPAEGKIIAFAGGSRKAS